MDLDQRIFQDRVCQRDSERGKGIVSVAKGQPACQSTHVRGKSPVPGGMPRPYGE